MHVDAHTGQTLKSILGQTTRKHGQQFRSGFDQVDLGTRRVDAAEVIF